MDEKIKAIISAGGVLAVNIAALFGISLDQGVVVNGLLAIAMLVSSIWGIWHNHNFTFAAQQGQLVTNRIKNEQRAISLKENEDA